MNTPEFKQSKAVLIELEKHLKVAYPKRKIRISGDFFYTNLAKFFVTIAKAEVELPAYFQGLNLFESKVRYTFNGETGALERTQKAPDEYGSPHNAPPEPKPAEIKRLFLKLRKELHPDVNYPSNTNYAANLKNAITYSNFKVKTERKTRRFRKQRKSTRRNARHRV